MSKQSKTATTHEMSIELADWAQDAIVEELRKTQWVELPFREAVTYLEQECNHFLDAEYPEDFFFFAAQYLIQSTDEKRFSSPVIELLGVLFAWETQIRNFGKEWFKERTDHLLALMRTLPPEQDTTLLALLHAVDPGIRKIMLKFAQNASKKANDGRHAANRKRRASAMIEWENWGERDPKGKKVAKSFAKDHCSKYGVTVEVMCRWIREYEKDKRASVGSTLHGV